MRLDDSIHNEHLSRANDRNYNKNPYIEQSPDSICVSKCVFGSSRKNISPDDDFEDESEYLTPKLDTRKSISMNTSTLNSTN